MIVWAGKGIWAGVGIFLIMLAANYLTNVASGDNGYWDAHHWPMGCALLVCALFCFLFGSSLRKARAKVLIDTETAEQVVIRQNHSLFFIPVFWWAPILAVIGIATIVSEFVS